MAIGDIFQDDIGTSIGGTVKDQDKDVVDVSVAITKTIRFTKPSGVSEDQVAAFVTDGSDGKIHYITVSGDLDETGIWYYQGIVELPLGTWATDIHSFEVEAPLVAP
jgi:hypothetical protein